MIPANSHLHLSRNATLHNNAITPKLPDTILQYLEDLLHNPTLTNTLENCTTARFCMSPTIPGCLNALGHIISELDTTPTLTFHVYTNANEITNYYNWEYLHENKLVFDAYLTKELWVLEPIMLLKIGEISVTRKNIQSKKLIVPFDDITHECSGMYHFKFDL